MATSQRARAYAGRVIAGSGAVEPSAVDHRDGTRRRRRRLPNFANPGLHLGQIRNGGYTGIEGILEALQGGMNAKQFERLAAGHTGGNGWGGIGGMHGAMSGLSPYATHFLSSLMEKKAAEHQSLTDETGAALTGDALWKAQLMNNLADQNAAANPSYQLHSGVDADFLTQLFGQGIGGHSAYAKGYGPEGGPPRRDSIFMPHQQGHRRDGFGQRMGNGFSRRRAFRPGGVVRRPLR